jgi:hypothetical protein
MNLNDVSKRDILDFDKFLKKVHDNNYKPLAPENQEGDPGLSGLSPIKREPAYDYAGYADSVFGKESKIGYPGISFRDPQSGKTAPFIQAGSMEMLGQGGGSQSVGSEVSESTGSFTLARLNDLSGVNEGLSTPEGDLKGIINDLLDRRFRDIDPVKAAEVFEFFAKAMRGNEYRMKNNIGPARADFTKR